jgi:predicted TPR repeat methyltransferase
MLQELCDYAIGVDLSENMIDKSDERACYDELFVNEAVHFLQEWAKRQEETHLPFDLIVATDVLPYIGALEPLFDGICANAESAARLVFSSETLPDEQMGGKAWRVTPNQRFAHSKHYLQEMCARAGFANITHFEDIVVRSEQGKPIPGYLVIADRR